LQCATLHINPFDFTCFGIVHELRIGDLILIFRPVKLFKNSEQDQTHNEPHTDFLQHIVIQKKTFAGLIRELKRIAIPKYLILLLGFFNSEEPIYFINPCY
jgi:hypothetical protein